MAFINILIAYHHHRFYLQYVFRDCIHFIKMIIFLSKPLHCALKTCLIPVNITQILLIMDGMYCFCVKLTTDLYCTMIRDFHILPHHF